MRAGRLGPALACASTGPSLYDGTAGIGLFLAEVACVSGDRIVGEVARGAFAHSFAQADGSDMDDGLYTGRAGVGIAAIRAGSVLRDDALVARGRALLRGMVSCPRLSPEADLLSGKAGTLLALLACRGDDLTAAARAIGDRLIDEAHRSDLGWSWPVVQPERPGLVGYSHGAAGIAWALLELARRTLEPKYQDASERALQYERSWFDTARGAWPDLRDARLEARPGDADLQHTNAWCHGAPGIAVSRLSIWRQTGAKPHGAELEAALAATARAVNAALRGSSGFSLCHGLAGNAEILSLGRSALDVDPGLEVQQVVERIVATCLDDRAVPAGGVLGARTYTPGLLLGTAGIGHFLLRQLEPTVPSVLSLPASMLA